MVADFVLCPWRGHRFSTRPGHEGGALRLGSERHGTDLVGARAGGIALEPRPLRLDEMSVLLLFGFGAGADARARSAGQRTRRRRECNHSNGGTSAHHLDRRVLLSAWLARPSGGLEVFRKRRPAEPRRESRSSGGGM